MDTLAQWMEPDDFRIEENVPIPFPEYGYGRKKGTLRIRIESLKVGQSLLFPVSTIQYRRRAYRRVLSTAGHINDSYFELGIPVKKFVVRCVEDGVRIWRQK